MVQGFVQVVVSPLVVQVGQFGAMGSPMLQAKDIFGTKIKNINKNKTLNKNIFFIF
jgi:hypothetical protein